MINENYGRNPARISSVKSRCIVACTGALLLSTSSWSVLAQELTAPFVSSNTTADSADITSVPAQGAGGRNGRAGSYSCSIWTWGKACVDVWQFGTVHPKAATNGYDAPTSGTFSEVDSDQSSIASVVDYDPNSVTSDGFSVEITQLAGTADRKVIISDKTTSFSAGQYVNGGGSFDINIVDQNNNPQTLSFGETVITDPLSGMPTLQGGYTLQDVADSINNGGFGLEASVIEDPDNAGQFVLSVQGALNDVTDFSVSAVNTSPTTGDPAGDPLSDLVFDGITQQSEAVDAQYTVTGADSGNGTFTNSANEIVIDGVTINLESLGTANISTTTVNAGVASGLDGLAGNAASDLTDTLSYSAIDLTGTAITLSQTGSDAGQAGRGGTGGKGGNGGAAVVDTVPIINFPIPFPTIPSTRVLVVDGAKGGNGAAGGTGGNGAIGGVGGGIDFQIASETTNATTGIDALSAGGRGGQGGTGGNGGSGGAGADAVAGVESNNLLPVVVSANGNIGGNGSTGGDGGNGGTGGTGGAVNLDFDLGTATVETGVKAGSVGGAGGQGGQGGIGGTGGMGGDGVAFTNYVTGKTSRNGRTGGLGGEGGAGSLGGVGGIGGTVTLTNSSTRIEALDTGIYGFSNGGQGGQGGQGGTGGFGGAGGNGDGVTNYVNQTVLASGGKGGLAGNGGLAGDGGLGGKGGLVEINNNEPGTIIAVNHGILGVSNGGIGGNGGTGGTGGTGGIGGEHGLILPTFEWPYYGGAWANAGNGGNGGNGGDGGIGGAGGSGGAVVIDNAQTIVTVGSDFATAIRAESLGAIGGVAGLAGDVGTGGAGREGGSYYEIGPVPPYFTGILTWDASQNGAAGTIAGTAGTANTTGGSGGDITISNAGNIKTTGTLSDGIFGISMGGVYGLPDYELSEVFRNGLFVDNQTGGAGDVNISNAGDIDVSGAGSAALSGLSIGAGRASGNVDVANTGIALTSGDDAHALVGASRVYILDSQTGEASGNVSVSNIAGGVQTSGKDASAIWAESSSQIGNSGVVMVDNTNGKALTGGANATAIKAVSNSEMGDAGAVTVDTSNGAVQTSGVDATAIWAQSIADQGNAAAVEVNNTGGFINLAGSGDASAIWIRSESSDTEGADSGDVTVNNSGGIIKGTTAGTQAIVDARSISASGDAGSIVFDNSEGDITSNNSGTAILLQSQALLGAAGNITGKNLSNIVSAASGATAVTLDSTGATEGDIKFDNSGLIEGGAGGTSLALVGGNNNVFTNDQTLHPGDDAVMRTAGGIMDTVISGTDGNDGIFNLNGGLIVGSMTLGTGINSFLNGENSLYEAGSVVNVGSGNLVENNGYWSTGSLDRIFNDSSSFGALNLTGDFSQGSSGQMLTNLDFVAGEGELDVADLMYVSGTATLGGFVTLDPIFGAGKPGEFKIPLLIAEAITDAGIDIFPTFVNGASSTSYTFRPSLLIEDGTLFLTYDIDYRGLDGGARLTPNQLALTETINAIQNAGITGYQPVANELASIVDPDEYSRALNSLTGEGTTSAQNLGAQARGSFFDTILRNTSTSMDCNGDQEMETHDSQTREQCNDDFRSWVSFTRSRGNTRPDYKNGDAQISNAARSTNSNWGAFGGIESSADDTTIFGLAFGYGRGDYRVKDRWTHGDMERGDIAVYLSKVFNEDAYVKAAVSFGYGSFEQHRYAMGRRVNGDFDTTSFGAQIEAGYSLFEGVTPFVGALWDHQTRDYFKEDNATWGNRYSSQDTKTQLLIYGLDLENKFELTDEFNLALSARIKGIHDISDDAQILVAPNPAQDFRYSVKGAPREQDRFRVELGASLFDNNGMSIKASVSTGIDSRDREDSASIDINWKF